MVKRIAMTKARVHLGKLVREVFTSGASFVLTKAGLPVAAIVPAPKKKVRR